MQQVGFGHVTADDRHVGMAVAVLEPVHEPRDEVGDQPGDDDLQGERADHLAVWAGGPAFSHERMAGGLRPTGGGVPAA